MDSQSSQRSGGRGPTHMGFLKEVRARGSRFPLELDSNGSPCGKWAFQFISYLGVCVRAHVSITVKMWKKIYDQLKANMWEDVKSIFDFDKTKINKKEQMKRMATMWRNHKSDLYCESIYGNKRGRDPCIDYQHITPEIWEEFLKIREDENSKKLRAASIDADKANTYPHTLSRGGYKALEQKMIQERLDSLKAAAEAEGQDSTSISIDQIHISREEKWKESKKSKSRNYISEESRVVGDRVVEPLQRKADGMFVESDKQDILVVAMGKEEHPGRVRGVGGGVGIKQYFGSSPRSRGEFVSRGEMQHAIDATLSKVLEQTVSQIAQATVHQTLSMMFNVMQTGQLPQIVDPCMQDMVTAHPIFKHLVAASQQISTPLPKSGKSSCSPQPSRDTFKEGQQCSLSIMDPDRRVVAYGSLSMSRILHCVELEDHLVRVRIEQVVVADAQLPCPDTDEEITLIRNAQGVFTIYLRS